MPNTQTRKPESNRRETQPTMKRPIDDLVRYSKEFARERPEYCALACLAVGFVLGWRLKPW